MNAPHFPVNPHGPHFPINPHGPHGPHQVNQQNVNPQININPQVNINPQHNANPPHFPQNNQINVNPQFQKSPNFNNQNMMMQQKRQQMEYELKKKEAIQLGEILKKQNEIMDQIKINGQINDQQRKTGEIVLFFKHADHNYDILPLTFTADQMVVEALTEYMTKSGKNNVKFYFKGKELKVNDTSGKLLYEVEGLKSGEEIKVITA